MILVLLDHESYSSFFVAERFYGPKESDGWIARRWRGTNAARNLPHPDELHDKLAKLGIFCHLQVSVAGLQAHVHSPDAGGASPPRLVSHGELVLGELVLRVYREPRRKDNHPRERDMEIL